MRFKTKCEKIFIIVVITGAILMLNKGISQAALQANATTHANPPSKKGAVWIEEIRKMETLGQTMGLDETLNTDLSPKTSNNIDVHMIRTTEYGAIAILSASGFGNPKKLSEVTEKTSTGNVTGVYMGTRWDWTAGVMSATTVGKNARYYDLYNSTNASAKVGDALGTADTPNKGCAGWHGTTNTGWLYAADRGFGRGGSGVFSFHGGYFWASYYCCGRGVAVVGTGL